ncbi:YadA-like family protein [Burkholderia cenocepacia]|uniref:YadA-like family protein n=1 Tax=Burkholderia cenocepacia TaxID=95486 RepID=UPI00158C9B5D|nr:YadA-like family protein [Burkholderia cenocepacia]
MNKTYRNVWNAATNTWTAAAETAKGARKGTRRTSAIACLLAGVLIGAASTAAIAEEVDGVDAAHQCDTGYAADGATCVAAEASTPAASRNIGMMSDIGIMLGTNAYEAGPGAAANGDQSVALGNNALTSASATSSIALGANTTASSNYSVAIGGATQTGRGAIVATGATGSIAIGTISSASAANAVALGMGSVADRAGTVSVGAGVPNIDGRTFARQIVNVAAGTQDNDAVNVAQMNAGLSTTNASIAATNSALSTTNASLSTTNATLSTTSSSLAATNATLSTANTRIAALNSDMATAKTDIATHTTDITTINSKLSELSNGTVGLVQQVNPGDDLTVGANTDGAAVNFAGTAGARKLTGIAAGDVSAASADAVNGAQLHGVAGSVASAIGGGSTVNPDGSISAPSFTVGDGSGGTTIVNSVGDVVTNVNDRITKNEDGIKDLGDQIGSGTVGLVRQANPGDDLTVGANTDGAAVNFTGTAGARKLTGIAAGDVSAASADAVNGAQLHGVAGSVASAIGGGSTVNPDGSISAPSFTVGDGSGGTTIVNSVGDVVTNLNGRVTNNEDGIKALSDQIGNGTLGLVQQNPATGTITVGAASGSTSVNFAGTGGARVLSGVANGVDDDDVVTVSQLRATGLIDYTGKEVGAVAYDTGLNFDTVTFAGTNGTKLQRVAAGEIGATSMDAINGSQLFDLQEQFAKQYGELSGQIGDLSSRFGDLSDRLGDLEANPGTGGPGTGDGSTVVGEGAVASGENGSAIGDGSLASGKNGSAIGQGAVASGENGSAIGQGAVASGSNGSAIGQGAVASGSNGSAIGQGAVASGSNGSAVGQGAAASGENSTALGQGASAAGSGSVAIGQGSVATEANTVSFGNGTAEGNRRLVNIADGINASDAATKGQLDRAMESVDQRFNDTNRAINDVAKNAYAGIAAAMAMPNMTPSQPGKTVVAVGAANFKSGSAVAAGATYRSRNGNWLVNGATSITSVGDVGVRAQVGYEF